MSLHLVTGYAGEEHITAADQGSFNLALMGNGQFVMDRGNKFSTTILTNNTVRIYDGDILMQGRHIRLKENTFEDLEFDNGAQGMMRNDLIVVRYEKNVSTGIESASFKVIKGTPSAGTAIDPSYTVGDITELSGDVVNEMPLYRVVIAGITLTTVAPLFQILNTWKTLQERAALNIQGAVDEMKQDIDDSIAVMEERINGLIDGVSVIYTTSIPVTGWTAENNLYRRNITVTGLLATDQPIIDLNLNNVTGDSLFDLQDEWSKLLRVSIANNQLTVYVSNTPTIPIPLKILCIRK